MNRYKILHLHANDQYLHKIRENFCNMIQNYMQNYTNHAQLYKNWQNYTNYTHNLRIDVTSFLNPQHNREQT